MKILIPSLRYRLCFEEAMSGFDEMFTREKGVNREDRIHGSLLVLNELLRVSNASWERTYEDRSPLGKIRWVFHECLKF